MVLLVHIAPESEARAIRRNGIAPTRWRPDPYGYPECDRVVWAFPVLPSYTLTLSWARELEALGPRIAGRADLPPARRRAGLRTAFLARAARHVRRRGLRADPRRARSARL
jgi:hypothetical protein